MRAILGIMASAVMLSAAPALAQTDKSVDDLRCMAVALRMVESENATLRASGLSAMMYFFGRLDADAPDIDLESALANTITKMRPEDYVAESQRCGQILIDRGKALKAAGDGMVKRGLKEDRERNTL